MKTEIFKFNKFQLCTIITEDQEQHLFSANDVCAILEIKNSRDAINRLDEDERVSVKTTTNGGEQKVNAVTEAGLYRLIFTSRKPEARALQRFVFHEVLPILRKQGFFERLEAQEITEFGKSMMRTVKGLDVKVQNKFRYTNGGEYLIRLNNESHIAFYDQGEFYWVINGQDFSCYEDECEVQGSIARRLK